MKQEENKSKTDILSMMNKLSGMVDTMLTADVSENAMSKHPIYDFKLDISGISTDNKIVNEQHGLVVKNGKRIIKPFAGLFYGNSLIISHGDTVLTPGKDYILGTSSFNKQKLKLYNTDIYDYILILVHINSAVISYQAVGGDMTNSTVKLIANTFDALDVLIKDNTSEPVCKVTTEKKLTRSLNSIRKLENTQPSITSVKMYIRSEDDGVQWFTIGEFGSDGDTTGLFGIDIFSNLHNWGYSLNVGVNLTNVKNKLEVVVINSLATNVYNCNDYTTLCYLNNTVFKLRLLWNGTINYKTKSIENYSGAILQIGISTGKDTVDILNISNTTLSNKLKLYEPIKAVPAQNTGEILLPSGDMWSEELECSNVVDTNVFPKNGYVVWVGEMAIIDTIHTSVELETDIKRVLPNLSDVSYIEFIIYDRLNKTNIVVSSRHSSAEFTMSGAVLFYPEDLCILKFILSYTQDTTILSIGSVLGKHSINNDRFDLLQIVLKFT